MYLPPEDRNSPLFAQIAKLQPAAAAPSRSAFGKELVQARNEVAQFASARPVAGLQRRSRFQEVS